MAVTGWSRQHGDLRVPHFIGLHAVQMLPAIVWLIGPLGAVARRRRAVVVAAAAYVALFAILLAQALAGQPVLAPEGRVVWAFAAWAVAVVAGSVSVFAARTDAATGDRAPMMVSR